MAPSYGASRAAGHVGGDYYDFIEMPDGLLAIAFDLNVDGIGLVLLFWAVVKGLGRLKDPAAFLEVASEITRRKPILAIKAGRTFEGSVAVSSHTGTLVDQAAMATAMFRKAGVLEFHDTERMIKALLAEPSAS